MTGKKPSRRWMEGELRRAKAKRDKLDLRIADLLDKQHDLDDFIVQMTQEIERTPR